MKTSVETLEPVKVKLTVEVEPARVKQAMDKAAKTIARGVQLPGFRKGKVPRKLLEQRFGAEALVQQALDDNLGVFYAEALEAEELHPVARPEIDLDIFDEQEGCRFSAEIEIVPDFEVPDHTGIGLTHPEWDVDDESVDEQIEQLRQRFAEVDEVDRAAAKGDYVTIDLTIKVDGEELEGAGAQDALYEIGSGSVNPELDDTLVGMAAGADATYTAALPEVFPEHGGEQAEFTVTVKDVREKTLPALDDDFAETASEFDTFEELRKSVRDNLLARRIVDARQTLRDRVLEAYLAQVEVPLPPSLVADHVENRREIIERQAQQMGLELEAFLDSQETSLENWESDLQSQAELTVKGQIVLDALARKLDLDVTAQDLDVEIYRHAQYQGVRPEDVARSIQEQGLVGMLVGDALRRKAVDALLDAADLDGGPSDDVLVEVGLKPADEPEGDTDEAAEADVDADAAAEA